MKACYDKHHAFSQGKLRVLGVLSVENSALARQVPKHHLVREILMLPLQFIRSGHKLMNIAVTMTVIIY